MQSARDQTIEVSLQRHWNKMETQFDFLFGNQKRNKKEARKKVD